MRRRTPVHHGLTAIAVADLMSRDESRHGSLDLLERLRPDRWWRPLEAHVDSLPGHEQGRHTRDHLGTPTPPGPRGKPLPPWSAGRGRVYIVRVIERPIGRSINYQELACLRVAAIQA